MSASFRGVFSRRMAGRLTRFSFVGAASTLSYFILTNAAAQLGMGAELASVLCYLLLMPPSFLGHRRMTFASRGNAARQWLRFCLVHSVNIVLVYAIAWLVVGRHNAPPTLAFLLSSVFVPIINFVLFQLWVFSPRPSGDENDFI